MSTTSAVSHAEMGPYAASAAARSDSHAATAVRIVVSSIARPLPTSPSTAAQIRMVEHFRGCVAQRPGAALWKAALSCHKMHPQLRLCASFNNHWPTKHARCHARKHSSMHSSCSEDCLLVSYRPLGKPWLIIGHHEEE